MQNASSERNQRRHKRNMSLYYGTVAFIVIVIFAVLSVTVLFNIETANVRGSSIYSADEIIAASGIKGGDNMIRKNLGKAEKNIVKQLVYIEEAEINRVLPSSVEIVITPCRETACFQNEDGFFVVSAKGKILKSVESPIENIPVFYGVNPVEGMTVGMTFASEDENKTEVIYKLMEYTDSAFASGITAFDVSDRLNLSCVYEDRIDIEIGVISDIDYKFRLAEEILSTKISPDAEGRLKMLEDGAQFLSKSDLEQIEENYKINMETSLTSGTEVPEGSETSASESEVSTKLNFE